MTTTNKLVSLESVIKILVEWDMNAPFVETIKNQVNAIPTYPEPTKGSNHTLLQEYIDSAESVLNGWEANVLREIQSRLTELTEYEIGKEYEFSDEGEKWQSRIFYGYISSVAKGSTSDTERWRRIRTIPPELTSAISVLEANGYTVCKK